MKTCSKCGVQGDASRFTTKGKYTLNYCKDCEGKRQRESKARLRAERGTPEYLARKVCAGCNATLKFAASAGRTPYCKACGRRNRKGQKQGKCDVCGQPCWSTSRAGRKCRVCSDAIRNAARRKPFALSEGDYNDKRSRQAAYDRDVRVRKIKKARERDPERFMEFALGEFWKLDGPCSGQPGRPCHEGPNGTRKWIVGPGSCYTCATGRPRTLFRFSERIERDELPV